MFNFSANQVSTRLLKTGSDFYPRGCLYFERQFLQIAYLTSAVPSLEEQPVFYKTAFNLFKIIRMSITTKNFLKLFNEMNINFLF